MEEDIQGNTALADLYRHACVLGNQWYEIGRAMALFDCEERRWYLVHSNRRAFRDYLDHSIAPHPLRQRKAEHYDARVPVERCPWCGIHLVEDPEFLAARGPFAPLQLEDGCHEPCDVPASRGGGNALPNPPTDGPRLRTMLGLH